MLHQKQSTTLNIWINICRHFFQVLSINFEQNFYDDPPEHISITKDVEKIHSKCQDLHDQLCFDHYYYYYPIESFYLSGSGGNNKINSDIVDQEKEVNTTHRLGVGRQQDSNRLATHLSEFSSLDPNDKDGSRRVI